MPNAHPPAATTPRDIQPAEGSDSSGAASVSQGGRVDRDAVIAAARRLGRFTMPELAAELGATNRDPLRQHVLGIRRGGNLLASGSGPSRCYEWSDSTADPSEPPPQVAPAPAPDGRASLALRLIDERLAWLEETKASLTAARAELIDPGSNAPKE